MFSGDQSPAPVPAAPTPEAAFLHMLQVRLEVPLCPEQATAVQGAVADFSQAISTLVGHEISLSVDIRPMTEVVAEQTAQHKFEAERHDFEAWREQQRAATARLQNARLSNRTWQVARLIAQGMSNGEIATKLQLSEATVKGYTSDTFSKLGVKSRSELAAIFAGCIWADRSEL